MGNTGRYDPKPERKKLKIVLIDNYDSFVYNLWQYLSELSAEVDVFRNDEVPSDLSRYSGIVISPGPGRPENAGRTPHIIEKYAGRKPILGVCLGHQAIGYVFGAKIINAKRIMHGKTSKIKHDGKGIFEGVENPSVGTRYHSLVLESVPKDFVLSAISLEDEEIMGIRHKNFPLEGIQFHPESIMTHQGKKMIDNFLKICSLYAEE